MCKINYQKYDFKKKTGRERRHEDKTRNFKCFFDIQFAIFFLTVSY